MTDNKLPDKCECCGDDSSLYLHPRCHAESPTWAVLTGTMVTIECAECGGVVIRMRVKEVCEP